MIDLIYLISGNIDPKRDTDKIHYDILKSSSKEKPHILFFATASDGLDWHQEYCENISNIFDKYNCSFEIIDNPNKSNIVNKLKKSDIIYFLGGSPYKHTRLFEYKEEFKKVPIKVGTSAGAIFLGYETFFFQKDDYIISVPKMLNFVNLHILPHSETHKEDIVNNYLLNETNINFAKIYNQAAIKINQEKEISIILGEATNQKEKVEIFINGKPKMVFEADQINIGKI